MEDTRAPQIAEFEWEAEVLVAHQLDLVAQIERQLRAVHRTMRQIEQLRSAKRRVGHELSNGQKSHTLQHLTEELTAIDQELSTQHESCLEMQSTVEKMRAQLRAMRPHPKTRSTDPESSSQPGA